MVAEEVCAYQVNGKITLAYKTDEGLFMQEITPELAKELACKLIMVIKAIQSQTKEDL